MGSATAPWKQLLLSAMDSNSRLKHTSFFQLATIGSNGRPSNRTVVFRGFEENSDKIQINTDCRSRKIEEINHCQFAEICWYFTDSWEQFRINGRIDIIDGSNSDPLKREQREKAWFASSPRSRLQYLGPVPGLPSLSEESPEEPSLDPSAGPVAAFCLLILDPNQVDYLNLKSNQRLAFTSKTSVNQVKSWTTAKLGCMQLQACRAKHLASMSIHPKPKGNEKGDVAFPSRIVEHSFEQDAFLERHFWFSPGKSRTCLILHLIYQKPKLVLSGSCTRLVEPGSLGSCWDLPVT